MTSDDKSLIFEQYKLLFNSSEKISDRRFEMNKFYISITIAIFGFMGFVLGSSLLKDYSSIAMIGIGTVGVLLNINWYSNILVYRNLNSAKFKIIHMMEKDLPYQCFADEWPIFKEKQKKNLGKNFTDLENNLPILLMLPYFVMFILALCF